MPTRNLELHVRSGRAVLISQAGREFDPRRIGLPEPLVDSLHEWAHVVEAVGQDVSDRELVAKRGKQLAMRVAVETGGEVGYADPVSGTINRVGNARDVRQRRPRSRQAPTPWATGLTVSAIIATIVLIVLVVVTLGLADVNGFLALGVNLAIAAGFAPSIWLGRRMPVWRWVAFGTAGGIVLAWGALLFSTLG